MRHKVVVILMAAAMTLAAADAALAASVSHVTIAYNSSTAHFHGWVTSPNAECIAHRTVRLYKKTGSGPMLEGQGTTGTRGGWNVVAMHPHGRYFAVAPQQVVMGMTCGRSVSGVVSVM